MNDNKLFVAQRFQDGVLSYLEPLTEKLINVLHRLIEYPFVPEVSCLAFEVFYDSFSEFFPIRVFFLDEFNNEYFIHVNGQAEYPCDVNPGLLDIPSVYPHEFIKQFCAEDPNIDYFTLSSKALIPWFSKCWHIAGGGNFQRKAIIRIHDGSQYFDLIEQIWKD
ncbi:MAG: hypothetical protein ABSA77_10345 [Thermoguttaceae bacterium]|jgi:hypothetical protein